MESIEIVLAMLLAVVISGYLVRIVPYSLPLPIIQIALGAVIAGIFGRGVVLDPEIFFVLFIPPLLFLDGWRIPKDGLFRDKTIVLELAFGLVVFTVVGMGFLIYWMIPAIPLPVAFALAAIVSPTDPVALSAIKGRAPVTKRLMHILEGESLLNDATGLVCFRFAVAAALTGSFSLLSASMTFLWVALAGIVIGVIITSGVGFGHYWLSRRLGEEKGLPILISLLLPFGAHLLAERLHASGILAAVAAGITMSYFELSGRALATTRIQRAAVWDTAQFALNGITFVLLGEQLPSILQGAAISVEQSGRLNPWWLAVFALVITMGLALLRLIWVWASLHLTLFRARKRGQQIRKPHWKLVVATSLAGVRGTITMAGVMTLPLLMPDGTPFPARELVVFLASSVILLSLAMASIGLPRLLQGLQLPEEPTSLIEVDVARQAAASAAIAAVERAHRDLSYEALDADIHASAASRVITLYQLRLHPQEGAPAERDAEHFRKADQAERSLRMVGLKAEREAIYSLARLKQISDEVARRLVREIDLAESRYH